MHNINYPSRLKIPSHVMGFHCAQCGQCCTDRWRIDVDDLSYKKLYKKFEELGRQQELYDNIQSHDVAPRIRFLTNGKCPYLTADNRCSIQLEIGGEYLLDICKIFPRRIFASPHALEFALSMTCRTAVETLLHDKIRVIEIDWPVNEGQGSTFSFMFPNTITRYFPDKIFDGDPSLAYRALEDRFIELLQDRRYSVMQRLIGLGRMISCLVTKKEIVDNTVTNSLLCISDALNSQYPDSNVEDHLQQLFLVFNKYLSKSLSAVSSMLLRNILSALSSVKSQQIDENLMVRSKIPPPSSDEYRKILDKYYSPVYSNFETILENYMVNFILSKNYYMYPLEIAYYRMAFVYAAFIAFALGHSILADQMVSQNTVLQAIYDVENIFYNSWFYPFVSALHGGKSSQQIIDCGIALVNI